MTQFSIKIQIDARKKSTYKEKSLQHWETVGSTTLARSLAKLTGNAAKVRFYRGHCARGGLLEKLDEQYPTVNQVRRR
jgi:hypothetical protein